jgi:hypothetical protein
VPALSADAAFADAANAAAAAFASNPPYVAYRLDLRTNDGSGEKNEVLQIVLRTSDGAVVVDDRSARRRQAAPPALPPTVDALADWAFGLEKTNGYPVMHVNYQQPRHYAFSTPGPNADVVVAIINGFSVRYADDDPAHLQLEPATAAVKALATERDRFLYHDVWFDPSTRLPTRVVVTAVNGTLTLDYATVWGRWLLSRVRYTVVDQTRRPARPTSIDATYGGYAFPADGDAFR